MHINISINNENYNDFIILQKHKLLLSDIK